MDQAGRDEVTIKTREDGPYKVTGPVSLTDAAGVPYPHVEGPLALCRCGRSRTKPYCDGSHRRTGFCARQRATGSPGPPRRGRRETAGSPGPSTLAVHAGLPRPVDGEPLLPGPVFAAPFHLAGDPAPGRPSGYARAAHPTTERLEAALGALEGGEAVAFASGMGAIAAVMLSLLRAGDVLVAPHDGYFDVRALIERELEPRGVQARLVPTEDAAIAAALDGARLLWLETPSNPRLDVVDVEALAAAAHAQGALVAVDDTLATPLRLRPLDLGADYAVAAATKQLSGHSDLLLGYAAVRDPERARALRAHRGLTGGVPGPFEAWLAHRSLATLAVRVERQEATAEALAAMLAAREDVGWVRWPGLGALVTFDLGARERAEAFLAACELVAEATSFGGVHATAERRARWGADDVPGGLVRLSVGLEDAPDLLADVERALDAAGRAVGPGA